MKRTLLTVAFWLIFATIILSTSAVIVLTARVLTPIETAR